jgi:hypothetical protein
MIPPWSCPESVDNKHRAKRPENQANITLSGLWAVFGEHFSQRRPKYILLKN